MVAINCKNVLVSQPPLHEIGLPYLPVTWGILKTYWEYYGFQKERITWLQPINQVAEVSTLLRPYQDQSIDVLILSCYIWNWKLQCLVAQEVKIRYPNCLVIAGGPEPDYKDPNFFKKHPYINILSNKDGEITITHILQKLLELGDIGELLTNKSLLANIPGLYLPASNGDGSICTGAAEVPKEFPYSFYLEQSSYYENMLETFGTNTVAVWETNRGCPYSCSFCDWGSNTMSKLRLFPMERIKEEIEWFGRMKVGFLMLADANFGLLPRDLEIADLVVETNKKYGFPKYFTYNTAKNNPDRTLEIAKKFLDSGLLSAHVLSIQHTSPEVLAATNRKNIATDKQYDVTKSLMEDGIPIYVQLILGIPGDKYELWKACFSDLMEWGIHAHYWVFPYNLLPNAPASEPDYLEKWEIETVERYILLNHGVRLRSPISPTDRKTPIIVKTKTFSRSDWVNMQVYTAYIKAFHGCSVTQLIAIYLRFTHNVPYSQFYEDLFDNFFTQITPFKEWRQAIWQLYETYLKNPNIITFMDVSQLPKFEFQIEPSRWLFIQICWHIEQYFESLTAYLLTKYPDFLLLQSVIEYQKNLLILPSYDNKQGKVFSTNFDWLTYFSQVRQLVSYSPLAEPQPSPGALIKVSDEACTQERMLLPLEWGNGNEEDQWARWIHTVVVGRNSSEKNNFQKLEIVYPQK